MTGQAPQTLSELNNTPPPVPLPSLGGGESLADVGALGQLNQFMAAGGANAIIERPQDPATLTLDDLIDNRRRQTDAMLATHFREAAVADPKLAGEAQRLGLSLDPKINPIDIERNVDGYRQLLAQKDAEQRAIAVQSPTLRRQLADPHFARIAFDRVDDLEFFDGLYKNYRAGRLTIEEGNLGDRFRRGIATNSDLANLQYIEKEMATLPARSGGPLDGLFRYVGQWSVTLPKALAVGAAAGTGAAILGQLGPQIGAPEEIISVPTAFTVGMLTETWASTARSEGGAMYLDMVRQGFDKNTAANVAGLAGIASGALEVVGLGVVGAPVKKALFGEVRRKVSELLLAPTMKRAGVEAAKGYLQGTLGEVGTEVLQTINEIIAKEVARPSGQKRVTFDEITTQVAETIVETAKGMAILGAVGPGIKLAADRRSVQRAQEQQRTIAQFLTRASELAPEAKARNPVAFEKSLQEMAKDSGAEVFYVDARTLGEMLRQQDKDQTQAGQGLTKSVASQIDEVVPGFSEQLAEAERTGGDVQIPSATFAARLGDTPLAAQMAPHMRLDPEDMSAAEAEKVAQEAEAQAAADEEIFAAIEKAKEQGLDAKQAIAKASSLNEQQAGEALIRYERQVAAREFQASLGRVREIIDQGEVVDGKRRAGLVEAAPSLPKVQRRAVGDAFEAAVAQLAENENISPEEAWRRYGPAIANQELTGDALQQFAGVQAKGVNKATMKKAWSMLAEGKSSAEIFSATGWSVSPEGTLRIELSDEAANLKGVVDSRLGDVLDHPALFKAYPQLADIPVSFTKVGAGIAGVYRPSRGISKWDASTASIRIADSLTDAMKLRTLLHEVQHAIQNIESEGTVQTRAQIAAASEVEARNVETRRKMTAAERAATPPEATEDVPRNLVLKRKDEFTMSDAEVAKAEQAAIEARTSIVEARKKPAAIEQAGQLNQPARGGFIRRALQILFGEKSDASTVLHELTHWYTEIVDRLAQQGSPWAVQQMGVLLDRWKLTREQWDAMPDAERAKHYEDISYNAEEYFATGQAPTAALARVFEKLRTFILGIYKNIRGSLNAAYRQEFGVDLPAMTPELRGFFDRMLAGKEAVEQAAAERQLSPLFLDEKARKAAGITDEQWAEVQRLDAEAKEQAVADLTAKAVRGMGTFENARLRVVREFQRKLADTRAQVKAEVEKEVGSRPVYAAMQAIRYGEVIDENGQPQSAKLDTDAVRRILGDDADKLPHSLTRKGGVSPDAMAEQFGMGTGEAMLREMVAAPPMEDAVTQRTDERMQAEHSDLTDPKKLRRAIEEALHTSARGKLIATELRHLLNETRSTAALIGAAKEAARRILLRTAVGKISPRAFVAAEARAAKQAREALASGDVQEAIEAQRRYLLQHELTRQSLAIVAEVDKFVEAADSRYFADDEKVVRGRNLDIVQAARSILGEYGLASGRRYEKALRYLEVLRVENPELHAELVALVSDVSAEAQDYRSTPLEQFRVMVNAVESLWDRAKRANEIDVNGKRMARAEVKEQLLATSQRRYGEKPKPVDPKTIRARVAAASSGIGALLKRVEHWAEWVDGGTGAWTNYVVRPMFKRFDDYMASREQRVKVLRDIIKGLDLRNEAIDASQFLGDGVSFKNTAELLGAMLHMGNASNLQKLLGGYRWAAQNAEGEFDTAGWWRFVSHAIETGRITKSHLDALQQMWDLMEDMKHEAQKVNRDLYGTYFEEIKAQPFETPFGRYRGGYAPATPDPTRAENADLAVREGLDAIQDAERNFRESMPSAGRGFTKTRNAATRPLTLDVRLVGKHVDQVLRFVHMQPSLRDAASLLRDRELAGYLNAVDPTLINGVLVPWLERTAANRTAQRGKSPFLDGMFAWMRRAVGMATMFGNVTNAAQNVTGITNALVYVERRHLVGAMWTGWTRDSAKEAAHLSKFMDQRLNSQIGQLQDDIDLALDPSAWGRLKDWTNRNGYFLQRMVQNRLDPIVWWGAFNQSMEKAGATRDDAAAVQQAVDDADAAVRKSQGGQRAIDVAAYEAGTPFARLFTQYSGYFNTVLNQISSQRGASAKAVAAVHALIFPTFVAGVIAAALNGRDDIEDKDGDGYSDEYMAWFFGQQIRGAAGLVPGFGPNALKALSAWGAVPGSANPGNRLALAPAFSMAETAIRAVGDLPKVLSGQAKAGQVRDFFSVLSLSGLPLAPVGRGLSTFMDEGR